MHQSGDDLCVDSGSSKPVSYPEKRYKGLSPWAGAGWGGKRNWKISKKTEIFLGIHIHEMLGPCMWVTVLKHGSQAMRWLCPSLTCVLSC